MVTIFTTAKPFTAHTGIIQRNALNSWKALHAEVEVILFGDDEGSAEACAEFGLTHEPKVERFEGKVPYVNELFARAQQIARHECLCYANCDIIFLPDFVKAIIQLKGMRTKFLAVGRRWNVDISEPVDFAIGDWANKVRNAALRGKQQQGEWFIDYFVFSRDFFGSDIPPLVVGRAGWDNWVLWKGCRSGHPVVDLSADVMAVHQSHDYGHLPLGRAGVYSGADVDRNVRLAGGPDHLASINDAPRVLRNGKFGHNYRRDWIRLKTWAEESIPKSIRTLTYKVWLPSLHLCLDLTRPLRRKLGLRAGSSRRGKEYE